MEIERPKAVKYWSIALGVFLAFGLVIRLLAAAGGNLAPQVELPSLWASLLTFALEGVAIYGLWMMRKWGPVGLVAMWVWLALWPAEPVKELGWMGGMWFSVLSMLAFVAFFVITLRSHWPKMTWAPLPISDRTRGA